MRRIWIVIITKRGCFQRDDGKIPQNQKGKRFYVTALEAKLGRPLKAGFYACHECDNRPCFNPDHLFEGTQKDNMRDAIKKGRFAPCIENLVRTRIAKAQKTHCPHGHKYTPENTYERPKTKGKVCKECGRIRNRRSTIHVDAETDCIKGYW